MLPRKRLLMSNGLKELLGVFFFFECVALPESFCILSFCLCVWFCVWLCLCLCLCCLVVSLPCADLEFAKCCAIGTSLLLSTLCAYNPIEVAPFNGFFKSGSCILRSLGPIPLSLYVQPFSSRKVIICTHLMGANQYL